MKIYLAGYNVDTEVLEELQKSSGARADVTPETFSASYARISRDPRPINEIRSASRSDVERSRKSNQAIVFKMGHHSVAEHAVFNFDLIGVSRLALEALERFRLCSYTEKSQRYITLGNDYVVPEEIARAGHEDLFRKTVDAQNEMYHSLFGKLRDYVFAKNSDLARDPKKHTLLEGWAKEDARYITSLATQGQVGETINARNLELLFRRFASHPLDEVRKIGEEMYRLVEKVAPSIILFVRANDYDGRTYPCLESLSRNFVGRYPMPKSAGKENVRLVDYTPQGDERVLAALLHTASAQSYEDCWDLARRLSNDEKIDMFKTAAQHMEFYDSVLREFEYVNLTFELVISAACFGQLKRHRLSTQTYQPYDPRLGVTIPEAIIAAGLEKQFMEVVERTNDAYEVISRDTSVAAPYVLTNSHRRRVLLRVNARELYHISRLREDPTAQWDIQKQSKLMSGLAKRVMPMAFMFIGGKDQYPRIYREIFKRDPKL
ncbi:MAG: FAD-dependent thymidylate synthase, partial [Candidatus Omnitrophica bacterium]|nr:FAD-dependent thymidylate synthase [Candidatus Omnitrophota bacterium]